jgi:hypothetical protein
VRNQVVEIADAIAVSFPGQLERMQDRVLAAEADTREMSFAAGLTALAPAGDDGGDVAS